LLSLAYAIKDSKIAAKVITITISLMPRLAVEEEHKVNTDTFINFI